MTGKRASKKKRAQLKKSQSKSTPLTSKPTAKAIEIEELEEEEEDPDEQSLPPAPPPSPPLANLFAVPRSVSPIPASPLYLRESPHSPMDSSEYESDDIESQEESSLEGSPRPGGIELCCYEPGNLAQSFDPWMHIKLRTIMHPVDHQVFARRLFRFVYNKQRMSCKTFTEWLLSERLLCRGLHCTRHRDKQLNLSRWNRVNSPSGGYCWFGDCCPTRAVSVYSHSIFQETELTPLQVLYLIYEWARGSTVCKAKYYVREPSMVSILRLFTQLRAVCVLRLQRQPLLGCGGSTVEAVIAEVPGAPHCRLLGALDRQSCGIRLQLRGGFDPEKDAKTSLQELHEQLGRWVDAAAVLCIDSSLEEHTLKELGFEHIFCKDSLLDEWSNRHIVYYIMELVKCLKHILSLPDVSLNQVQLLMHEILWREAFGGNSYEAFVNIVSNLGDQTQNITHKGVVKRLQFVATNPFKYWSDSDL